jgi:dTDP-4-dehydrorhamnose reductase
VSLRAMIAGADGTLGRHLARRLTRAGVEVAALTRAELDVLDVEGCHRTVAAHAPAVMIDCSLPRPDDIAGGAANVACAAAAVGAHSVYISCAAVFDGEADGPYVESDAPAPASPLGVAKLDAERAVTLSNAAHTIVRTGWLVEQPSDDPAALAGSLGDVRATPTPASLLAGALVDLVRRPERGIVHLSCGGSCTADELARLLEADVEGRHLHLAPAAESQRAHANLVLATRRGRISPLPAWSAALARPARSTSRIGTA